MIVDNKIIDRIIIMGNANMLYDNDLINCLFKINLKALVNPHDGHGILNIFLKIHGILKLI